MPEVVHEIYNLRRDFRLQFFKTETGKFHYQQQCYMYDRFTSRIEWSLYWPNHTSAEFETLELAKEHASSNVEWPSKVPNSAIYP